jgi:LysR family hydrogen peroxide-inducible transcriptional activator
MLSIAQIQYILALLEYKNFQKASNACFVTQPTLSMQVKKAEEMLGNKIIDRDTNPISLTPFGKKIIPHIQQINDEYKALNTTLDKIEGTYKAEIRIGIIPTIAGYLVPELYSQWQKEIGNIRLEIKELKSEQILESLEAKTIDIGIMAGPITDLKFKHQVLFNEEILIYAPKIEGRTISVEQLENEKPWLLSQGNCLRTQMINFCNLNEIHKDDWSYEGGSLNLLLKMVEQEGGYTLVPENYLKFLSLPKSDFKSIPNHIPVRQIVGLHMERNSKKEYLNQIMRTIQHSKGNNQLHLKNIELLPWN